MVSKPDESHVRHMSGTVAEMEGEKAINTPDITINACHPMVIEEEVTKMDGLLPEFQSAQTEQAEQNDGFMLPSSMVINENNDSMVTETASLSSKGVQKAPEKSHVNDSLESLSVSFPVIKFPWFENTEDGAIQLPPILCGEVDERSKAERGGSSKDMQPAEGMDKGKARGEGRSNREHKNRSFKQHGVGHDVRQQSHSVIRRNHKNVKNGPYVYNGVERQLGETLGPTFFR